jgi:hypothetical protein
MRKFIFVTFLVFFLFSISMSVTASEKAADGLKEALQVGVKNAVKKVGVLDGYFKNEMIKIVLPKDLRTAEEYLDKIGAGKYTDQVVERMNRAAEEAAPLAQDIFMDAVKKLTFDDALKILNGKDNEATKYLQEKTTSSLTESFTPIVRQSMDKVGAIKAYNDLVDKYSKNPLLEKVDLDLNKYVTEHAIEGLFKVVAEEEAKIRKDPEARISDLLKDVFGGMFGSE